MASKRLHQFSVRGLLGLALIVCLSLAWWREHSQHQELLNGYASLSYPAVMFWSPAGVERFDVGIGTFTVGGHLLMDPDKSLPTSVTGQAEFVRTSDSHVIARCELSVDERDINVLEFSGEVFAGNPSDLETGYYFVRVTIRESGTGELLAEATQLCELVDGRQVQKKRAVPDNDRD